jgi:circadian clock protein KaiB
MSTFSFILYTVGNTPNSVQAISNLQKMCEEHFPDNRIEIVDLFKDPDRAVTDGIVVTPTLIKIAPEPRQMIMGNLSDTKRVLHAVSWSKNGATK